MATHEAVWGSQMHMVPAERGPWLHSKRWDLCFLTFSSILVVIPLALYELVGSTATFVNLFIAGVIGGPHMYATFFRTALDPSFCRQHRWLMTTSLGIPILVVLIALWNFQLLITLFFFWASIHVLHQLTYIMECYDRQRHRPLPLWSRLIDYAVVFTCLFPIASYKFIHDEFYIGETLLLYPAALQTNVIFYIITGIFALALCLFLGKTLVEMRQGTAHYPKILLMLITVSLALLITSYSGPRLEIAFQGFNTWHSFQYLALTWYITTLRLQRGERVAPVLHWLAAARQGLFARFYGANFLLTLGALGLIGIIFAFSGLPFEHSYYIVVLSFLLVHYYHDHVLFTQFGVLTRSV